MWGKSYLDKQKSLDFKAFPVVYMPPAGLEPATHRLRVYCSTN